MSRTTKDEREIRRTASPESHSEREVAADRLAKLPTRFLRWAAVRDRTGLSRSTIWRLERRGAFPRHRRISANTVGWVENEVEQWLNERVEAS